MEALARLFGIHNAAGLIPVVIILFYWAYLKYASYNRNHYRRTEQHCRAQHPPIARKWRFKRPTGMVIGKAGNDFFCIPEKKDLMNVLVLGGSGAGKSSGPIACTILQNAINKQAQQSGGKQNGEE